MRALIAGALVENARSRGSAASRLALHGSELAPRASRCDAHQGDRACDEKGENDLDRVARGYCGLERLQRRLTATGFE